MTINSKGGKRCQDKDKGVEDGILGERQIALQVRDMNANASNEDEKDNRASDALQDPGIVQMHQQQGPVLYWERLLHVTSIRVLLVETDDSTRYIVTALLRNCKYEVLEAGNGLDAWKILEDLTQHIDLVLTEVLMPFVSGIALLRMIMNHKTRKNIPVIMMSSHDSMGLVFNCLSKGAVDFLVKPIRKNELKNLWQHIWRRCHSSSGSGSESGTQTLKSEKSKDSLKSDRSESGREEKNGSNGLNVGGGSDDGSCAQSSWTKQSVEVDSSQTMSPVYQIAECPDSTCAQVIRLNAETSGNKRVDMIVAREGRDQNLPDTVVKGKESKARAHRNVKLESEKPTEISTPIGAKMKYLDTDCNMTIKQIDDVQFNPTRKHLIRKEKDGTHIMSDTPIDVKQSGCSREVSINNNSTDDSGEPNFKPSLKRLREVQGTGKCVGDDCNVFQHSEQSAFSRYNTSSNAFKTPNGITGSSAMISHSVEIAKRPSVGDNRAHSTGHLVHQNSVGNFPKMDMDFTSNKLPSDPWISKDNTELRSTLNGSHPSVFRPVRYPKHAKLLVLPNYMQITELDPARNSLNNHLTYLEQQPASNHDESSLKKVYADASLCGTTDTIGGNMDVDNPKNYSLSRSASGCNHGRNGLKGSSNVINAAGNIAESHVGQALKSESGDGSGSGSGTRVNENKIAHREAALNKFRQKRMGRCFEKKVRYHNRKKLAEQRPRVRGKFVKQAVTDSLTSNF